jgi:leucyl aminopeptidase
VDVFLIVAKSKRAADEWSGRCRHAALVCESVNWARDLANAASNDMTPAQLAYEARALADWLHLGNETLDEGRMAELGMHALLGVAKGSAEPPKLIVLTHHYGHNVPTVAIVGKGVTFDTGGVSIKPAEKMHEMKWDMSGAAAVLGVMRVVGHLKPRVNVVCVAPAVENTLDARAQKPGDIVKAYNGKTIEVYNTDAEGRLILADALAYTLDHYQPDYTVDVATLTGAAVVAFGHYAAAVVSTDEALLESLRASGEAVGERLWPMPLWDDYRKLIEGTHADVCNIGPPREASTIVGGCFLREFIGDARWAHIDIAGTAYGAQHIPYLDPKSASGFGVRLLSKWIESESAAVSRK